MIDRSFTVECHVGGDVPVSFRFSHVKPVCSPNAMILFHGVWDVVALIKTRSLEETDQ